MGDTWDSGASYELFMGRWSRLVATSFVEQLSPAHGLQWLDVGCGSGALSEVIIQSAKPAALTAIDQSENFVSTAQERLGNQAECKVGNALNVPLDDFSVDATVSGLVLNFIPESAKALAEMKRVTAPGGTVAIYVWDYSGKMDLLNYLWDAAVELNPEALSLHEGKRFSDSNPVSLEGLFEESGLKEITAFPIEITMQFRDFDDYWQPFFGGQGPAPSYVLSLSEFERGQLKDALVERLSYRAEEPISLAARAWAVKGRV
jgi:SAM-dependent methyltransferase